MFAHADLVHLILCEWKYRRVSLVNYGALLYGL
jgi:hypothetical protein